MHLTDCFINLVAYVAHFQQSGVAGQPPYDQVKTSIMRLLSESEVHAGKGPFSKDDYDKARFMVCAWIDEAILSSSWSHKNLWQREQLQRLYYNTTDAGEEAFDHLNALEFHQREVREVYYLCLALGFKGRFIHRGDDYLLDQVKTSNLKLLLGSSVGVPSVDRAELFPEAFPLHTGPITQQKWRFRFSAVTLAAIAGPVLLFGMLYLIYYFVLNGITENFIKMG